MCIQWAIQHGEAFANDFFRFSVRFRMEYSKQSNKYVRRVAEMEEKRSETLKKTRKNISHVDSS